MACVPRSVDTFNVDYRRSYKCRQVTLGTAEACQDSAIAIWCCKPQGGISNLNLRVLEIEFSLTPSHHENDDQCTDQKQ